MRCMYTKQTSRANAPWTPKGLFVLEWRKDAQGYDMSPDGASILRRQGPMLHAYEPDLVTPPLHLTFADLGSRIVQPDELVDPSATQPDTHFSERRFTSENEALLAFVREYGFLGSATWGADVAQESLDYLSTQRRNLSAFLAFSRDMPGDALAAAFNAAVPPMSLRMVRARAGGFRIGLQAQSLIGWMWLRAARDFANGVRYDSEPCKWCGKPFVSGVPSPGVRRTNAKFCSDNCRKEHWRHAAKATPKTTAKRKGHK